MKTARSNQPSAFTLVELLIVVGIIAVLIAMLMPALSKVREQSRQVMCMSNLRQLGQAMISYAADNDGYLPATANAKMDSSGAYAGKYPSSDWVFWEPSRAINQSALGKYLGLNPTSLGVLRCPSDDIATRPASGTSMTPYPFSYVMNWLIASDSSYIQSTTPPYIPPTAAPSPVQTLHRVLNPSQKVLMYEEDVVSLDDGEGMAWAGCTSFTPNGDPDKTWGQVGMVNLLSLRHEPSKAPADPSTANSKTGLWSSAVPVPDARGNVVFCDGHADFVSRAFLHRPDHTIGSQY